jgi:hypothetical protein
MREKATSLEPNARRLCEKRINEMLQKAASEFMKATIECCMLNHNAREGHARKNLQEKATMLELQC